MSARKLAATALCPSVIILSPSGLQEHRHPPLQCLLRLHFCSLAIKVSWSYGAPEIHPGDITTGPPQQPKSAAPWSA